MRRINSASLLVATVLLALLACSKEVPPAAAESESEAANAVVLTAEEAGKLGIATVPVQSAQFHQRGAGFGTVVGLETVAQTFAELKSSEAAAAQSRAAAAREQSLAGGEEAAVSQEVLEAAQSKAMADEAALSLAQGKSDAVFGRDAPWRTGADRDRALRDLAAGRAVLVRVTFPSGALGPARPASIHVARIGTSEVGWSTNSVWSAPADPTIPGAGFYGLLGGSNLTQGEHVTAWTGVGAALNGVWIPQAAILLSEGATWVYVDLGSSHFKRIAVDVSRPDRDGYFIMADAGISPEQRVVVGGAGLLLARELNPGSGGGD